MRPRLLPLVLTVAAAAALTLGSGMAAQAVVIPEAITNVTVTPTTPAQNSQLTTTIDWCVPNGTKEGDTFTLTLSSHLDDLPLGFELDDPTTGDEVATAVLSPGTPSVITFTMTAYAAAHLNICGNAFVKSGFNSVTTPSGVVTPLTFTTSDGRTFTTDITPTGRIGNRADAIKYGTFTGADQGRSVAADFISYHVDTPVGPFDTAETLDRVPVGQNWTFDCSTLRFAAVRVDSNFDFVSTAPVTPTSVACSTTNIAVEWGPQTALHLDELLVSVSLPAPTGTTSAPQTFTNSAQVTTVLGGVSTIFAAPASNVQSSSGGTGSGVLPAAAPTATPTASAAPVAADPVATPDAELAFTGSNAVLPLSVAGALLLLGFGFVVAARRRTAVRPK